MDTIFNKVVDFRGEIAALLCAVLWAIASVIYARLGELLPPLQLNLQVNAGLSEKTYNCLADRKGRVIIASRNSDEVSWELSEMRNGLFSHLYYGFGRGEPAPCFGSQS